MPLAGPELRIEDAGEQSIGVALHRTTYVVEVQVGKQHICDVSPRKPTCSE